MQVLCPTPPERPRKIGTLERDRPRSGFVVCRPRLTSISRIGLSHLIQGKDGAYWREKIRDLKSFSLLELTTFTSKTDIDFWPQYSKTKTESRIFFFSMHHSSPVPSLKFRTSKLRWGGGDSEMGPGETWNIFLSGRLPGQVCYSFSELYVEPRYGMMDQTQWKGVVFSWFFHRLEHSSGANIIFEGNAHTSREKRLKAIFFYGMPLRFSVPSFRSQFQKSSREIENFAMKWKSSHPLSWSCAVICCPRSTSVIPVVRSSSVQ